VTFALYFIYLKIQLKFLATLANIVLLKWISEVAKLMFIVISCC